MAAGMSQPPQRGLLLPTYHTGPDPEKLDPEMGDALVNWVLCAMWR